MHAPTPTFARLNELDHLAVRRATRKSGSLTYCNDAAAIQQRYVDDVNGLGAELLAAGHDPQAVAAEMERYARNYRDRIGSVHQGIADDKPDVAERQARFDKWHADARAKILATLAGAVGQFEPVIEQRNLRISVNKQAGTARVEFAEKPDQATRDALKEAGWRWQSGAQAWEAPIEQVEDAKRTLGVNGHAERLAQERTTAKRGRA